MAKKKTAQLFLHTHTFTPISAQAGALKKNPAAKQALKFIDRAISIFSDRIKQNVGTNKPGTAAHIASGLSLLASARVQLAEVIDL